MDMSTAHACWKLLSNHHLAQINDQIAIKLD